MNHPFIIHSESSKPSYGYGSIPIHTIFRGMNIHLPAILMFTRTHPHISPVPRVPTNSHGRGRGWQLCAIPSAGAAKGRRCVGDQAMLQVTWRRNGDRFFDGWVEQMGWKPWFNQPKWLNNGWLMVEYSGWSPQKWQELCIEKWRRRVV